MDVGQILITIICFKLCIAGETLSLSLCLYVICPRVFVCFITSFVFRKPMADARMLSPPPQMGSGDKFAHVTPLTVYYG